MYLFEFFLGLITSFWGSLPVGVISLVVVEVTVQQDARAGAWAALGVGLVEVLQAFVALACIAYFIQYPWLKTVVLAVSVPVFMVLGYQHLRHDGQPKRQSQTAQHRSPFLRGAFISSLNMVVIPFWILWGGIYLDQQQLQPHWMHFGAFAMGAGTGAFCAMLLYVALGVLAYQHIQRYNLWFNRLIGVLFFGIAGMVIYNILRDLC